jgi:hypothetical protein
LAVFIYGWLYERLAPDNPVGYSEDDLEEELGRLLPHWGDED